MRRRFQRRPPPWLWATLGIAVALAARWRLEPHDQPRLLKPGSATVTGVIDGRSLTVAALHGEPPVRVRLLGVKPVDEAAARQWLLEHVVGETVAIELDKRRQASDGACFAYLYVDRTFINAELISTGFAAHEAYPGDSASHGRALRSAGSR